VQKKALPISASCNAPRAALSLERLRSGVSACNSAFAGGPHGDFIVLAPGREELLEASARTKARVARFDCELCPFR